MEMNEVLERLPAHLMNLIIEQPYNEYTPQDHAVWRYVMRQNINYLPQVAHRSYLNGLKETGISIDSIPQLYGMNRILKKIGWAAVAVDGFIPPSAFMEFQAHNVLVIAADIRPIDQIEYTPAPDILHEAAGHAPIIADPEYSEYLRLFGEIGAKAFLSKQDYELYEAIRLLSILKANPFTNENIIKEAEEHIECLQHNMGVPSELSQIRNLHWWTVEYGLIGDINKPKIYGAGLLSSIGESYSSLQDDVKKMPYNLEAARIPFDITTRQPQLFVTPDFGHLVDILKKFEKTMAYHKGGHEGVQKAIESGHYSTIVLDSGIAISGVFEHYEEINNQPIYIISSEGSALSYGNKQIEGLGREKFSTGIALPLGRPERCNKPIWQMSGYELKSLGLHEGVRNRLMFKNGMCIHGIFRDYIRKDGKTLALSFDECYISLNGRTLIDDLHNNYIIPLGEHVISAYNGVADPNNFGLKYPLPKTRTQKIEYDTSSISRHDLYRRVRRFRNEQNGYSELSNVIGETIFTDKSNWLLALEIYELIKNNKHFLVESGFIEKILNEYKSTNPELVKLIDDGLTLISD
ncbi:MAG: aromatic amino acid hydroxylase [Hyphomicrobiales bacterium]